MKAILCSQYCQPDDLVLADVPDPVAEPGQAVIAIKAAALNFFDILMIQGKYQIKPPFPVFAGRRGCRRDRKRRRRRHRPQGRRPRGGVLRP
jgi:NADPH:quinone reductase-like Zn-dependent oxidoreductase